MDSNYANKTNTSSHIYLKKTVNQLQLKSTSMNEPHA